MMNRDAAEDLCSSWPSAGPTVDGRIVREEIPNQESIRASLLDFDPREDSWGVKELPLDLFSLSGQHYSVSGTENIRSLAEEIDLTREINPIIVVVDPEGPYVLEGATRMEALFILDAQSVPALVIIDDNSFAEDSALEPEENPYTDEAEVFIEKGWGLDSLFRPPGHPAPPSPPKGKAFEDRREELNELLVKYVELFTGLIDEVEETRDYNIQLPAFGSLAGPFDARTRLHPDDILAAGLPGTPENAGRPPRYGLKYAAPLHWLASSRERFADIFEKVLEESRDSWDGMQSQDWEERLEAVDDEGKWLHEDYLDQMAKEVSADASHQWLGDSPYPYLAATTGTDEDSARGNSVGFSLHYPSLKQKGAFKGSLQRDAGGRRDLRDGQALPEDFDSSYVSWVWHLLATSKNLKANRLYNRLYRYLVAGQIDVGWLVGLLTNRSLYREETPFIQREIRFPYSDPSEGGPPDPEAEEEIRWAHLFSPAYRGVAGHQILYFDDDQKALVEKNSDPNHYFSGKKLEQRDWRWARDDEGDLESWDPYEGATQMEVALGPGEQPDEGWAQTSEYIPVFGGVLKAWSPLQRSDLFTDNVSELKDELVEERGEEWRRRGRDTSSFAEAYFPRFPHFRPKGDRERVRKFIEKVEDSFSAILEDLFVALKKFFDVDPQEWRPDQIRSKKAARTEQRSRRKAVFRKMPSRASLVEVAKTLAATTKEGKSSPSWYLDEGLTSVRAPNTQVGHLPTVKAFSLLGELLKLVEYQTGWKIVVNRKCFLWSMWTGEPPERWFEPVPMYLNFPRRKEYSHVSELDESEFGAKRSRPFLGSANYVKVESAHFAAHRSGRFDGLTAESKEELPKEDTQVFCFSVLAPRFVNMKFVLDLNEMEREVDAHTDEEEPLTEEDIEELKRSTLERSVWHQAEGDFVAVPLKFRSDFRQEGTSLRHCIGVDPKYFENYRKGNRSFYSLRSKSGKPKFTIEVTGKVGDFKRQILQVKGMNNRLPGFRDSECTGKFKRSEYDLVTSFIDEYIQDARRDVPDLECAERLIKEGVRPNPSFYPERTFGSLDDYYEEER